MFIFKRLLSAAILLWLSMSSGALAAGGLYIISSMGNSNLLIHALKSGGDYDPMTTPMEKHCLAFALYHEARGEKKAGQRAVGATILNRVRSNAYPDTICGVVYQNAQMLNRCQFSFACDERSDEPKNHRVYREMKTLADGLIEDVHRSASSIATRRNSVSNGYTHYHRHDVSPSWSSQLQNLGRIGDHVFFRSERVVRRYRDHF